MMLNSKIEGFVKFLAQDKEREKKIHSLGGDVDALVAYAKECGFDLNRDELRAYQERQRKLMEAKIKKGAAQKSALPPGAKAFYSLLELGETDEEVREQLERLARDTTREELIAYGKEKGFIFDERDLDAVGKDILELHDELSEEELEMVAGGTNSATAAALNIGISSYMTGLYAATMMHKLRKYVEEEGWA